MSASSPRQPRLFIVGHAPGYRSELAEAFQTEGYEVSAYPDLALADYILQHQEGPDAVVLDWREGSLDFVTRHGGVIPVLLLSARGALLDVVQSFRAGAADFMRMPCHFPEILARVERAKGMAPTARRLTLGPVSLDVAAASAEIDGVPVTLSDREARILAALLRRPGQPVGREALMRAAGITEAQPTIVESYIKQLRKRHALLRDRIRTRYGRGYAFCQ